MGKFSSRYANLSPRQSATATKCFPQNLAQFVRTHEKALANALQLRKQRGKHGASAVFEGQSSPTQSSPPQASTHRTAASQLTAAFSIGPLSFGYQPVKPAKLTLTPHHLFYLLSRFEELGVEIGAMNVRIESLNSDQSPTNYVSFLSRPPKSRGRSDRDSIHSIGSIRSVMSNMTSFWSSLGMGEANSAKSEKAQAQLHNDTKYLYSAFTKIPCLRLAPDHRARLIHGYEEFPFDTAVPLWAFKNLSALEICDLDFRQFFGWDRLADQLRSLSIKRTSIEDPLDLIVNIVLDDMDKRRRRSSKPQNPPTPTWPAGPSARQVDAPRSSFAPGTPDTPRLGASLSPQNGMHARAESEIVSARMSRNKSSSPTRPSSRRQGASHRHTKTGSEIMRRSGSGSSNSSSHSLVPTARSRSSTNLLSMGILPASKWRFLRHLSLADNSLTSLTAAGLAPLSNTLQSLDLSSNLFTEIPDCLATLTALRALNLANCMIESLHSLARSPLPAISALNLRANRLVSIAGSERLFSLERLDLRENRVADPTEMARLTGLPDIRELYLLDNPLAKLHGNYRITVFNLFRAAAGYTEDILIDSAGPGYSERRQLRERTSEAAAVPVHRPPPQLMDPESSHSQSSRIPSNITSRVITSDRPLPRTTQSEAIVSANRRKKASKRRIVDLAVDESARRKSKRPSIEGALGRPAMTTPDLSSSNASSMFQQAPFDMHQAVGSGDHGFMPQPGGQTPPNIDPNLRNTMTPPQTPPAPAPLPALAPEASLADELENLKLTGNAEAYRQKVETLKEQFGSSWLRMLNESGWDASTDVKGGHSSLSHPPVPTLRASGQSIVSSGRTLG